MEIVNSLHLHQTSDYSAAFDTGDADYLVMVTTSASLGGPNSITFDGASFTKSFSRADTYKPDGTGSIELAIWTLQNPSQGSFTLAVDANAAGSDTYAITLFALKGVNATSPIAGTDESSHDGGATFALSVTTPYTDSFGILFGTVYQNFAGFDYHIAGTGFTRQVDEQGIQNDNNGGQYVVYRIFTTAGAQSLDGGHNNVDGSPTKSIEVAIILNGTTLAAAGSFFLVM